MISFNGHQGLDYHGVNPQQIGYYANAESQRTLPGPRLGRNYAVMNPDSYAYLAFLLRMREYQWVAFIKTIQVGAKDIDLMKFKKDEDLPMRKREDERFFI
jgi:hypothetical protein